MNNTKTKLIVAAMLMIPLFFITVGVDAAEPPPIIPEYIHTKADQEEEMLKDIFGPEWQSVLNVMEATRQGDIATFIREGKKIMAVTPRIMATLGLDLIFPINQNYLGGVEIDPSTEGLNVNIGGQQLEIIDFDTLDAEGLLLNMNITGYETEAIEIKDYFKENVVGITADEVEFKTDVPVVVEEGKLYVKDLLEEDEEDQNVKINKLPPKAIREVKTRYKRFEAGEVILEMKDGQPTYMISGEIDGKVLWLFPVKFDVTAEYDAEKGSLKKVDKPWWELFVF